MQCAMCWPKSRRAEKWNLKLDLKFLNNNLLEWSNVSPKLCFAFNVGDAPPLPPPWFSNKIAFQSACMFPSNFLRTVLIRSVPVHLPALGKYVCCSYIHVLFLFFLCFLAKPHQQHFVCSLANIYWFVLARKIERRGGRVWNSKSLGGGGDCLVSVDFTMDLWHSRGIQIVVALVICVAILQNLSEQELLQYSPALTIHIQMDRIDAYRHTNWHGTHTLTYT